MPRAWGIQTFSQTSGSPTALERAREVSTTLHPWNLGWSVGVAAQNNFHYVWPNVGLGTFSIINLRERRWLESWEGKKHQDRQRHLRNAIKPLPSSRFSRLAVLLPEERDTHYGRRAVALCYLDTREKRSSSLRLGCRRVSEDACSSTQCNNIPVNRPGQSL
ncbi:hypothetical protein VTO42DRAFT_2253 [Malbranchea cinnamomea]